MRILPGLTFIDFYADISTMPLTPSDWEQCLQTLHVIARDPQLIDDNPQFKTLIAKIYRKGRKQAKRRERENQLASDRAKRARTLAQRAGQAQPALLIPDLSQPFDVLAKAASCYICKQRYVELHHFYHQLCPACADLNYRKRRQRADLAGRVVLITGARIKIGYQTALRCLRDGATVYATTRFPQDALQRYRQEPDYAEWESRLWVYGLDLRNVAALHDFITFMLDHVPQLDVLINNAAQTIRRPIAYYQHLLSRPTELESARLLQPEIDLLEIAAPQKQLRDLSRYFPRDEWDEDGLPLDKREANSWSATLADVGVRELVEVQLVNSIAPFILCSQLKPLLLKSPHERRFIVNVSAMEGQFNRPNKTHHHPHTNMAKAALNMLTRTSASDYARDHIYMNSVDTGWITDENPYPKRMRQKESGFVPPLDIVDGCTRILDPVYMGLNQADEPLYGHFLKDYAPHAW